MIGVVVVVVVIVVGVVASNGGLVIDVRGRVVCCAAND